MHCRDNKLLSNLKSSNIIDFSIVNDELLGINGCNNLCIYILVTVSNISNTYSRS